MATKKNYLTKEILSHKGKKKQKGIKHKKKGYDHRRIEIKKLRRLKIRRCKRTAELYTNIPFALKTPFRFFIHHSSKD